MKQYALRYTCGHYYCGCHGEPIPPASKDYVRRHRWQIKDIDSPCPKCAKEEG